MGINTPRKKKKINVANEVPVLISPSPVFNGCDVVTANLQSQKCANDNTKKAQKRKSDAILEETPPLKSVKSSAYVFDWNNCQFAVPAELEPQFCVTPREKNNVNIMEAPVLKSVTPPSNIYDDNFQITAELTPQYVGVSTSTPLISKNVGVLEETPLIKLANQNTYILNLDNDHFVVPVNSQPQLCEKPKEKKKKKILKKIKNALTKVPFVKSLVTASNVPKIKYESMVPANLPSQPCANMNINRPQKRKRVDVLEEATPVESIKLNTQAEADLQLQCFETRK